MAGSRGGTSKADDLAAQPDGTVHWSKAMRETLAKFKDQPCNNCGGQLTAEHGLAESLDYFRRHRFDWNQRHPAQMRMLELHGPAAAELFFAQAPGKEALSDLLAIHDATVVRFLVSQVKQVECKSALVKQASRWPLLVLRELLSANPARHQAGAALVLELLAAHPEWQAPLEAACDADQRKTLARLQEDGSEGLTDAAAKDWPDFLRRPPWKDRQALPAIPTLALPLVAQAPVLHWHNVEFEPHERMTGEIDDWLTSEVQSKRQASPWRFDDFVRIQSAPPQAQDWDNPRKALWMLGLRPELIEAVASNDRPIMGPEDFDKRPDNLWASADTLWMLSAPLAIAAFEHAPLDSYYMGSAAFVRPILHEFGIAALPGLPRQLKQGSRAMFNLGAAIEWDRLAVWVAKGLHTNRWVRDEAARWLSHYPDTAARGLIPDALGEPGAAREAARAALRWLHGAGHAAAVLEQARAYGSEAADAVAQLLAIAPEDLLPDNLPAIPRSLPIATLPRLVLKHDGHALPQAVVPDVLMAMALSKADAPYPGLTALLAAVTPDSLARFGRALLAWWIGNGRPGKERWMFALQGLLGEDETARQLFGLLRQWRAALDRVRAYDALAMLGEIGSDAALTLLAELTRQTRHADINARAAAMLDEVAEQRGLSRAQLADRTVPDLGLDARGRLTLDFGARSFELRMDAQCQPVLRDGAGKPIKALPKPSASDDTAKAAAATELLKDLRKSVKTIASAQLKRLEAAMCEQRRWDLDEFLPFFARHPVVGVFSRQLVWGLFDPATDALASCLRVSAEGELTDLHDEAIAPSPALRVGLPHPLEIAALDASLATAWAAVLADYEILQPFEQLMRQTFTLAPALRDRKDLPHWAGRSVSNAGLLGLETRGWSRNVGDGGMVNSFSRSATDTQSISLEVEEGWYVQGAADPKQLQTVRHVSLDGPKESLGLGSLGPIVFSEIERELHRVVWAS